MRGRLVRLVRASQCGWEPSREADDVLICSVKSCLFTERFSREEDALDLSELG